MDRLISMSQNEQPSCPLSEMWDPLGNLTGRPDFSSRNEYIFSFNPLKCNSFWQMNFCKGFQILAPELSIQNHLPRLWNDVSTLMIGGCHPPGRARSFPGIIASSETNSHEGSNSFRGWMNSMGSYPSPRAPCHFQTLPSPSPTPDLQAFIMLELAILLN